MCNEKSVLAEDIEIYWSDLTAQKQQEILDALGDNCNFDIYPIASIPTQEPELELSMQPM